MALNYSAGFLGQAQVAPDSSLTPGTYAALAETGHWTLDPKANNADASVYGAEGVGQILTTRDPAPGIDGIYDYGDGGLTNLIQSCFPSIIGSAYVPSTRLWLRLLDAAGKGTELSTFVSELGISSDDPGNLTKFSAKFGYDGTPTQPYTTSTTLSILAPTTALNPAIQYLSSLAIGSSVTNTFTAGEPTAVIGATNTYQIGNTAKRFIDYTTALVVGGLGTNSGVPYTVDSLFGTIAFASALTAAPTITSGKYWTMSKLQGIPKFSASMKFTLDATVTDIAQSTGNVKRAPTTRDFSASFSGVGLSSDIPQSAGSAVGANTWRNIWENRAVFPIEYDPDGQQQRTLRAWVLMTTPQEAPEPGKIVQQNISLIGANQTLRGAVANYGATKFMQAGFGLGAP